MLTTREPIPFALSCSCTPMHNCTSLPLPKQDNLWITPFGVGEDIGAAHQAFGRCVFGAVHYRQSLPAEHEACRPVLHLHQDPVRLANLIGVGWPAHRQT